jgi:hypothetical protein
LVEIIVVSEAAAHFVEVVADGSLLRRLGPYPDRDIALLAARHLAKTAADHPSAVVLTP